MTFKTSVLLVALLALCLAVPSVMASNDIHIAFESSTQTFNLGTINDLHITFIFDLPSSEYGGAISNTVSMDKIDNYNYVLSNRSSQASAVYRIIRTAPPQAGVQSHTGNIVINYNYVEPTPEPTPVPSPYISVTELYSDNFGTVYRLQCLPDVNTIFYSNIVPYIIPAYMAPSYAGELMSSQTSIEYRVPAGGTSEFSAVYTTAPYTVGVISTTITAPPLTPAQNNTFNPIPDQSQKPLTPFTSGTWQPAISSGQIDVISKSPYIALLSNISDSVQLPVMESPQSVRDRLVPPELENITGPLYDLVDGWADFTNWVPRTIADTVVTLYTPFTSAIADCKTILLSMTAQLAELMKPMYILTPVMYLFIPDFVWIGVCMVLVLLILHALAVFIFGYDVTYYYMGRETIVADAVPEFPALEK